jgi:hypothetical protein
LIENRPVKTFSNHTNPLKDDATQAVSTALVWQAMQALLGELSPADDAAWEARLETDPAAQLALITAVRLHAGVGQIHPTMPVPVMMPAGTSTTVATTDPARRLSHSARPARPSMLIVSLTTAALATLLAVGIESPFSGSASRSQGELAALWQADGVGDFLADDDLGEDQLNPDDVVPEWLMAAVSLEQASAWETLDEEFRLNDALDVEDPLPEEN